MLVKAWLQLKLPLRFQALAARTSAKEMTAESVMLSYSNSFCCPQTLGCSQRHVSACRFTVRSDNFQGWEHFCARTLRAALWAGCFAQGY